MQDETVKLAPGEKARLQSEESKKMPAQDNHNRPAKTDNSDASHSPEGSLEKRAWEIRRRLENFLQGRDYNFNPDPEIVKSIIKAMAKRYQQFGADYCPCRRVVGDKEKDALIICPCVYHEQEVREDGHCHCQLFTKT